MSRKVYMTPNPMTPNKGQKLNAEICNGCNLCVEVYPTDVMMPNPVRRKPPLVLYPEECCFCAACIEECPRPGCYHDGPSVKSKYFRQLEAQGYGGVFPPRHEEPASAQYQTILRW